MPVTPPMLPIERSAYNTIRLDCEYAGGVRMHGTGFFFQFHKSSPEISATGIVTNRHVLHGAKSLRVALTKQAPDGTPIEGSMLKGDLDLRTFPVLFHPDPSVDLATVLIGPLIGQLEARQTPFFHMGIDQSMIVTDAERNEMTVMEDIVMVGYPIGLWDDVNNLPVIRRGVTATHPAKNFQGRPEFLIDCACYPGSSGSPVFWRWDMNNPDLVRRAKEQRVYPIKLLGVLWGGPWYAPDGRLEARPIRTALGTEVVPVMQAMVNLGFVVKAERILEFEPLVRSAILVRGEGLQELTDPPPHSVQP